MFKRFTCRWRNTWRSTTCFMLIFLKPTSHPNPTIKNIKQEIPLLTEFVFNRTNTHYTLPAITRYPVITIKLTTEIKRRWDGKTMGGKGIFNHSPPNPAKRKNSPLSQRRCQMFISTQVPNLEPLLDCALTLRPTYRGK